MKKIDAVISIVLVLTLAGVCLWAWLAPGDGASSGGHVHSENCSHSYGDSHGDLHDHAGHSHAPGEKCTHSRGDSHDHAHEHAHGGSHDHAHGDPHDHAHGGSHDHAHGDSHDHAHAHGMATEVVLSPNALRNIGLDGADPTVTLEAGEFVKRHSIPAIIQEFEGRTMSKVPAPYAGIITKIYHEPGEAVHPGAALFDVTLSLPEMLDAQTALLKLLETQEFLEHEIAEIDENLSGLAPQRRRELDVRLKETLIDIRDQKNAIRVLGLPEEVLQRVETERKPFTHVMTVCVPPVSHEGIVSEQNPGEVKVFVVFETLYVKVGQRVDVGEALCDLCDLCELTVRGDAFAINEGILLKALKDPETTVRVTFEGNGKASLEDLRLRMVESRIDEQDRTLSCFADFKNVVLDGAGPEPHSEEHPPLYVHWLYKPGQRCQMEIAYETVENVFVVPAGAVARNVHETFVFELTEETSCGEKLWKKTPVHLLFRTREHAVLANDGTVKAGIRIAANGASFILDALNAQNGSGAAIDPHAGHNH